MKEIILVLLHQAIDRLYSVDGKNIEDGVSERNFCARLAHHLENLMREYDNEHQSAEFKNYYADVEYNRMEDVSGDLISKQVYYSNGLHSVTCDLLIHSRDAEHRNLLALEMKKKHNSQNVESDKKRLETLVLPHDERIKHEYVCDTLVSIFMEIDKEGCQLEIYEYDNDAKKVSVISIPHHI